MPEAEPTLTIIAGPNGSGKSTFTRATRESLGVPVIDPDLEARLLRPDAPEAAALEGGRQAIPPRKGLSGKQREFCSRNYTVR